MALSFDEGSLIPNTPYSEGQRVSREKDILNPDDGLKIGVVTRLYASEARHDRRISYWKFTRLLGRMGLLTQVTFGTD